MKAVVRRVMQSAPMPIRLEEIDISRDAKLEALYGIDIPVLLVDGKKAAKYRITETALRTLVESQAGGAG